MEQGYSRSRRPVELICYSLEQEMRTGDGGRAIRLRGSVGRAGCPRLRVGSTSVNPAGMSVSHGNELANETSRA